MKRARSAARKDSAPPSTKSKKRTFAQMTKDDSTPSSSKSKSNTTQKRRKMEEPAVKKSPVRSALHSWSSAVNTAKAKAVEERKDSFACARAVRGGSQSKRSSSQKVEESKTKDFKMDIVDELNKILSKYKAAGDRGRVMGYQRAISNIKAFTKPISNADQMDEIPAVGEGIKKKVREFLAEGKMSKLESLQGDKRLQTLEMLSQIWGVGSVAANKLYSSGIRTIEQLRKRQSQLLTTN